MKNTIRQLDSVSDKQDSKKQKTKTKCRRKAMSRRKRNQIMVSVGYW